MTNNDDLALKLKAAAEKSTALNLDSAEIQRGNDGYYECPVCCGEGEVEAKTDFCNIDGVALGVQFYGIGEHHGAAEEYFRAVAPANILAMLAERDAKDARIAELETIATDYGMKFQRAQDDLKKAKILCEDATMRANRADFEGYSRAVREYGARKVSVEPGEVLVTVSGFTGSGKSAIAGEIEIAMKAIGVPVEWTNSDAEKRMTGADWLTAIEMYRPTVRIVEINVPRASISREVGDER